MEHIQLKQQNARFPEPKRRIHADWEQGKGYLMFAYSKQQLMEKSP
jgi:hypothetical protein